MSHHGLNHTYIYLLSKLVFFLFFLFLSPLFLLKGYQLLFSRGERAVFRDPPITWHTLVSADLFPSLLLSTLRGGYLKKENKYKYKYKNNK